MLLAIRGLPRSDDATIRVLTERVALKHHSAAEMVDRLEEHGYVPEPWTEGPASGHGVATAERQTVAQASGEASRWRAAQKPKRRIHQ
jgi:hypothetical protein